MKILVTGVTGQLGYDVVRELKRRGHEAIGAARQDFDLTDEGVAKVFLARVKPEAVIHCAAYTAVDKAEDEPELARRVNVDATAVLARMAKMLRAKFMYISTD